MLVSTNYNTSWYLNRWCLNILSMLRVYIFLYCVVRVLGLCDDGYFLNSSGHCGVCSAGYRCPNDLFDHQIACEPGSFQSQQGKSSIKNASIQNALM
jgi:hypothetical protein